MKNLNAKSACLILWVFVTVFAGCAPSTTLLFEDGFENIAVGKYPGENGWRNLFSGKTAHVSDDVQHSGSRSLRLECHSTWARTDYIALAELPDRLSYQVSVYPDPVPGRSVWVGFPEAFRNMGPFYNLISFHNKDGSVGTVDFNIGGSGALRDMYDPHSVNLGQFTVGRWVTVRADLDFINSTAELWVNGKLAATDVPILPKEFDDPSYGHVVLNKWGATEYNWRGDGTGVIYIDDVRIWARE